MGRSRRRGAWEPACGLPLAVTGAGLGGRLASLHPCVTAARLPPTSTPDAGHQGAVAPVGLGCCELGTIVSAHALSFLPALGRMTLNSPPLSAWFLISETSELDAVIHSLQRFLLKDSGPPIQADFSFKTRLSGTSSGKPSLTAHRPPPCTPSPSSLPRGVSPAASPHSAVSPCPALPGTEVPGMTEDKDEALSHSRVGQLGRSV